MQLELPTVRLAGSRLTKRTVSLAGHRHIVTGLFAGIGGIELGLHRAGHSAELLCENDPAAIAVLQDKFPRVEQHDDICTLERLPPATTLVAAGFPCQDL